MRWNHVAKQMKSSGLKAWQIAKQVVYRFLIFDIVHLHGALTLSHMQSSFRLQSLLSFVARLDPL